MCGDLLVTADVALFFFIMLRKFLLFLNEVSDLIKHSQDILYS